jgi:hypothetical protein
MNFAGEWGQYCIVTRVFITAFNEFQDTAFEYYLRVNVDYKNIQITMYML